jgi:2-polyprenyl-3-methyl-5-hydroxy-6-metoxy-1,4-benzoquinol methylase
MNKYICNYCQSNLPFGLELGKRPIVNDLQIDHSINLPTYSIKITICSNCGLHQLIHDIPKEKFYTNYMTPSNHKSEPHIPLLISEIMSLIDFQDSIVEIGCNDGKFLSILKQNGFRSLLGIEPTLNTSKSAADIGIEIINSYFNSEITKDIIKNFGKFNLVISRQVLEHIKDIKNFLIDAKSLIIEEGFMIIEVPDCEINFKQFDYGVWEEHVNCFTPITLKHILNEMGWEIIKSYRTIFSGWTQTLVLKPILTSGNAHNISKIKTKFNSLENEENDTLIRTVQEFKNWSFQYDSFKLSVHEKVNHLSKRRKIGLFGVGARSISTLYSLDLISSISYAFDESSLKIGKYIPGTKIIIESADNLNKYDIDLILLGVNFENENKVLNNFNFEKARVYSILPPSDILLWDI